MKCLTLTFVLLFAPTVLAVEPITIYLAGDSTMAEKIAEKRPETGWGEKLQQLFRQEKVVVSNHARNGRSTRTFIEEKRWDAILERLKPGDYVFIQFGHNDGSKEKKDRYTSPEEFRNNLIRFVNDVQSRKGISILLTPVVRRRFDQNGEFFDTHGEYPAIVRKVARQTKTPLLDMHLESERLLRSYGAERSRKLFLHLKAGENPNYPTGVEDNTHFSPFGAEEMARLAIIGLKQLCGDLVQHLKAETPEAATRSN